MSDSEMKKLVEHFLVVDAKAVTEKIPQIQKAEK